jgi:hypothetical protein
MKSYLQTAIEKHYAGKASEAIALAQKAAMAGSATEVEGGAVLCEILLRNHRYPELRTFLEECRKFKNDPRWILMSARLAMKDGKLYNLAEEHLEGLLQKNIPDYLFRMAGFDLVKLYDKCQRYEEAWQLAEKIHSRNKHVYPLSQLREALQQVATIPEDVVRQIRRSARVTGNTCFIHGLPRSGTTLLEQMLDCHPSIRALGETNITGHLGNDIAKQGQGWPVAVLQVSPEFLDQCTEKYIRQTRNNTIDSNIWTIDKTVFPTLQPLVVSVLFPQAKIIRIRRDPRDNAVSLFLNNFDPSWSFTASIPSIFEFMKCDHFYSGIIYQRLGMSLHEVSLEELIREPEAIMAGILDFLGLPFDAACINPDQNTRTVHTLSYDQVNTRINSESTGRWKNYAAFLPESY